ncbi:MAG: Cell wall assembly/cell proliferation coordinating protein [Bacteroidetes bacterium]|nr:Cell wall assembly/cell proliferation coordinating protein [Bacteroidota bacterium]
MEFKFLSEEKFRNREFEDTWGYQIQPGTKWNKGLSGIEIDNLEKLFGFEFPNDYKNMLSVINGFDLDHRSIDPDGEEPDDFERHCYIYPDDLPNVKWLIDEINEHIEYVNKTLSHKGYETNNVIGFIPLYGHRALVVFKDKSLSPVISIFQGTDVIIYGDSLINYWTHEFLLY